MLMKICITFRSLSPRILFLLCIRSRHVALRSKHNTQATPLYADFLLTVYVLAFPILFLPLSSAFTDWAAPWKIESIFASASSFYSPLLYCHAKQFCFYMFSSSSSFIPILERTSQLFVGRGMEEEEFETKVKNISWKDQHQSVEPWN